MARETLLDHARVPAANVHRWHAEAADLDAAARDYEFALRAPPGRPGSTWRCSGSAPTGIRRRCFPGQPRWQRRPARRRGRRARARRPPPDAHLPGAARRPRDLLPGRRRRDKRAALADVMRPASTLPAARIIHGPAAGLHILRPRRRPGYNFAAMKVLAGDIGGTNTRLAIYDVVDAIGVAAKPMFEQTYPSAAHSSLDLIAESFLARHRASWAASRTSSAPASASPGRSRTTSAAPPTCLGSSTGARCPSDWRSPRVCS